MTTKKRAPKAAKVSAALAEAPFPIVGIGASAGGLAAVEEFLGAVPTGESLGLAFVLVQHLDPDRKSLLLDLVRKYTEMDVEWAEDGTVVRPGHTYVNPPKKDMALESGRLVLVEPKAPRGQRLPIDYFAQTPESAAYDGMPRSAIATGMVDFVLPPADMPKQLLDYVSRAFGTDRPSRVELLQKVLPKKKKLDDYELILAGGSRESCTVKLNALELIQSPEKRRLILHTITSIDCGE